MDELPFVLGSDLRPRVVSFPDDCLHGDCRHDEDNCWINFMRDAAAEAQVIITNHHLLLNALELGFAGERILPPASVYVIDEAHHLEQIATAVYETIVTDYTVEQLLARTTLKEHVPDEEIWSSCAISIRWPFRRSPTRAATMPSRCRTSWKACASLAAPWASSASASSRPIPTPPRSNRPLHAAMRPPEEVAEKNRYYELTVETVNSTATKLQHGRHQPPRRQDGALCRAPL